MLWHRTAQGRITAYQALPSALPKGAGEVAIGAPATSKSLGPGEPPHASSMCSHCVAHVLQLSALGAIAPVLVLVPVKTFSNVFAYFHTFSPRRAVSRGCWGPPGFPGPPVLVLELVLVPVPELVLGTSTRY